MPAAPESRLTYAQSDKPRPAVTRLGVLAGGGDLPRLLLAACDELKVETFVIAFDGQTDPTTYNGRNYVLTRLGAAGKVIETLKDHDIADLVMIGAIRRPSIAELVPDFRTVQFFARVGLKAMGDDGLLKALRAELEREGFSIHGVQNFAGSLLAPSGALGRLKPGKEDWNDIRRGFEVSQALGHHDVGQAVIVQEDIVLGVEAAEGTDEMIRRCRSYRRKGRGGVLVKTCKPQQDRDFDLPVIGVETVRLCAESGLAGIVVQAGLSLVVDRAEVAAMADRRGIFVYGLSADEPGHGQ